MILAAGKRVRWSRTHAVDVCMEDVVQKVVPGKIAVVVVGGILVESKTVLGLVGFDSTEEEDTPVDAETGVCVVRKDENCDE